MAAATMAVLFGGAGLQPAHGQSASQPVATIDTGHVSQHLAFAPNGRWLASAGDDFTLKIWDVASGKMVRSIAAHAQAISAMRITADGRRIVTVSDDKTIKIWNAETGGLIRSLSHQNAPRGIGITAAKGELITLEVDDLRRWDMETGRMLGTVNAESSGFLPPGHPAFSQDGRLVAIEYGSTNGRARVAVLDAGTGRVVKAFDWRPKDGFDPVRELALSPDGRILVAACDDNQIRMWDLASGQLIHAIDVKQPPLDLAFSPDGRRLYSSASFEQNAVSVWDVASGSLLRKIQPFDNQYAASAIAISPDGRRLAMGSREIDLMDADSGATLGRMQGRLLEVLSVYPAPGDRWFSKSGETLQLWDASTGQPLQNSKTYPGNRLAAPGPDAKGRWLHAYWQNRRLVMWDAVTGEPAEPQIATKMWANAGISSDGGLLATSGEHLLEVWDTTTGMRLGSFERDAGVYTVGISPDHKWLVATAKQGHASLKIWDLSSGSLARTIADPGESQYKQASYSPDGRLIAVWEGDFRIFDAASGRRLWDIGFPNYINKQPVFSPDSRLIAISDEGSEVRLREATSGRKVRSLLGNSGTPSSIVFIQDGRRIVIGNTNGTSTMWATDTGELLATTVLAQSGEWLTATPEGFFDASEHGAESLHVVRGFEITGVEQVYQSLHRPDLLREKLAGDRRGLVRQASAQLDLNKVIASGTAPELRAGEAQAPASPTQAPARP
jgi:WD40 repeat protein